MFVDCLLFGLSGIGLIFATKGLSVAFQERAVHKKAAMRVLDNEILDVKDIFDKTRDIERLSIKGDKSRTGVQHHMVIIRGKLESDESVKSKY